MGSRRNLEYGMRRGFILLLTVALCALLALPFVSSRASPTDTGFKLQTVESRGNRYTVATVDLRKVQLKLFWKSPDNKKLGSLSNLEAYLTKNGRTFLAGMNAGIFDASATPLGLHVERGATLHALKTRRSGYGNFYLQPNAVFYLDQSGAHILETLAFERTRPAALEATQSGPALLLGGKVHPAFQPGSDNRLARNAVGVTSRNVVQLVISDSWVNFADMARFMRDSLKCTDALYLDGNISKLRVPGARSDDGDFAGMIGVYR
jgi:uncharacterized protein YigE (DUF2233 family)